MGYRGRFGNGKPKGIRIGKGRAFTKGSIPFGRRPAGAPGGAAAFGGPGTPRAPGPAKQKAQGAGPQGPAPCAFRARSAQPPPPPAPLGQPPTPKRREVRRPGGWVTPPGWSLGHRLQRGRRGPQARQGRQGAGQRPAGRGICPVDSIGPPARRTPGAAGSSRHSRGCR